MSTGRRRASGWYTVEVLGDMSSPADWVIIGCSNLIADQDGRYLLVKEAAGIRAGPVRRSIGQPDQRDDDAADRP